MKIPRVLVENQITTLSVVKIAIKFSPCTVHSSNLSINLTFTVSIEIIIVLTAKCSGTHRNFSSAAMNYPNFIFCVWNRQKQRSFPACGAAVKFHFIVVRRAAQKPPERGSVPGPRGGGGLHPYLPTGPPLPGPPPPFRQRQVCYDKDHIISYVHLRSGINRNLTPAPQQTNLHFLFPISDSVSYVPKQSNCIRVKFCILV